jgi:transmembrane sensor
VSRHEAPPLSGQITRDATTWFVEFNEGELNQADREAFIEWLKTSPEHIRAYLQVAAHWEEAGVRSKPSVPSITDLVALARAPVTGNVIRIGGSLPVGDATFAASPQKRSDNWPDASVRTRGSRRHLLAASLAIALIGASGLYWLERVRGVYTTDIGEQRSLQLPDGSTVDLDAHSKVRVTLREHERDVELIDGQALFRVAKDHSRPFIVHSGDINVLAVGTQFDVNKHRSGTTVTVVEGRVAVFPSAQAVGGGPELSRRAQDETLSSRAGQLTHAASAVKDGRLDSGSTVLAEPRQNAEEQTTKTEVFLAAGEQLTVSSASMQMATNADVVAVTGWTQKQIVFNSTPLSDVVEEFNRYNTRQLMITDPRIANKKISGEFSSTNPDSLIKGLDALNQFSIRATPSRIEIAAK